MEITKTFTAASPSAWREWLTKHGAAETEIWLVYYKKHTGKPSVTYQQALEEALCFGWIDGVRKKLDEERFAQRFTPRREESNWSEVNKRLARRLIQEGRMTPAGLARIDFPLPEADAPRPIRKEESLPDWLESALKASPRARANFEALPPSHQRRYLGWITDAKREETRRKRLREAIELLNENKHLGLGPGEVRK